jgi:hypothetical protein
MLARCRFLPRPPDQKQQIGCKMSQKKATSCSPIIVRSPLTMDLALTISLSSFVVAASTLFFTHLRPPKIVARIGPSIRIYYADYSTGGSFGIYVPATFLNLAGRTGTVLNAAITVHRSDAAEQQFFMQWRQFSKLDEDGDWTHETNAHALAVPGKSSETKMIWFMWQTGSEPKLLIREGEYLLRFLFWTRPGNKPCSIYHKFFVSNAVYEHLEGFRRDKRSTTTEIVLDQAFSANRLLTSHESKMLLDM